MALRQVQDLFHWQSSLKRILAFQLSKFAELSTLNRRCLGDGRVLVDEINCGLRSRPCIAHAHDKRTLYFFKATSTNGTQQERNAARAKEAFSVRKLLAGFRSAEGRLLCSSSPIRYQNKSPPGDERINRPDKTVPGKPAAGGSEGSDGDSENEDPFRQILRMAVRIAVAIGVIAFLSSLFGTDRDAIDPNASFVSWNEFVMHMLTRGEVRQVVVRPEARIATIYLYENAVINGRRTDRTRYYLNIGQSAGELQNFEERLRDIEDKLGVDARDRLQVVYVRESGADWVFLFALVSIALWIYYLYGKAPKAGAGGAGRGRFSMPNPFQSFTRARFTLVDPLAGEGRGVRLKDVAGMSEAKQEVMEFVDYLRTPDKYARLGAKVPKGALLLGPPGCGKTLLAKAVATEAKVPFLSMNGSEFIEMIGGLGAARVRDLFKQARRRAPCIIYIDEIDALGRQRGGANQFAGSTGEEEQTLNQLLVEMDGIGTQEGVLLLASTNRPDILDTALLRPGRFDRQITIEMPTPIERKEIFELYLRKIKLEKTEQLELLSQRLALLTAGMSGADIFNVVNEAALYAATSAKKSVKQTDFEFALDKVFRGSEKKSSAISPQEKRMRAFYLAGQCLAGWYLEHTDALLRISIKPRTLGFGFAQNVNREQKLYTKEELMDRMTMSLAGRAAELDTFNHTSTGSEKDLKKVTDIAYRVVKTFGMSEQVGLLSFRHTDENKFERKPYSKLLGNLFDMEASQLLGSAFQRAAEVIKTNKDKLLILADALIARETLTYKDVEELIGPSPWGKKQLIERIDWDSVLRESDGSSSSSPTDSPPPVREAVE